MKCRTCVYLNSENFCKINSSKWTYWVKAAICWNFLFISPNSPLGRWYKFILPPAVYDRSYFFILLIILNCQSFYSLSDGKKIIYFSLMYKKKLPRESVSFIYQLFVFLLWGRNLLFFFWNVKSFFLTSFTYKGSFPLRVINTFLYMLY